MQKQENQYQPMNMVYMTPEEFTRYLYEAINLGKAKEQKRSLEEDFMTKKEAMTLLRMKSETSFYKLLNAREFNEYGSGRKLYRKKEILEYLERTKNL